jgi:5-formyltetrahydrofolate cyclo-ligase
VGFYYPVRNEADTREIFCSLGSGKEAYFPRVSGQTDFP